MELGHPELPANLGELAQDWLHALTVVAPVPLQALDFVKNLEVLSFEEPEQLEELGPRRRSPRVDRARAPMSGGTPPADRLRTAVAVCGDALAESREQIDLQGISFLGCLQSFGEVTLSGAVRDRLSNRDAVLHCKAHSFDFDDLGG